MNAPQKVLIITYYWPPSGGAGVQRWLKLTKYLCKKEVEVHILTVFPEEASYVQFDNSLIKEIHPKITVHYSHSFEPINFYGKLVGKSKIPKAGFSNVTVQNWKQKFINRLRSHFFVPDPRIGWKKYAVQRATEIIEQEKINTIITTSPPHSVQMIGLTLKRKLQQKIKWVVDFRDPWTDIYYYPLLNNSAISHRKNKEKERDVIEESDVIITVSEGFKNIFASKTKEIPEDKIKVISNAFDSEDFDNVSFSSTAKKQFTIAYIGTMSEKYKPEVFFSALKNLMTEFPNAPITFESTGIISEKLKVYIDSLLGSKAFFFDSVPHDKAIKKMIEASVLLLVAPENKGIVPGKTFEYIASKNRIINLGEGDNAKIIEFCKAGASFSRTEEKEIYQYLKTAYLEFTEQIPFQPDEERIKKLSWKYKAEEIKKLID